MMEKRLVWCSDIVIQEWDVAVVGWKPGLQMALTVYDSGEPFLPPVFQIEVGVLPAHLGKQVPECIGEGKNRSAIGVTQAMTIGVNDRITMCKVY
jgi:hypothetical protein